MELWVRSQDKKVLYKVNELFIEKNVYKDWCIETPIGNDYIVKTGYNVCCNAVRFGIYETEERALEVLDEIHQRLINLGTIEIAPDSYIVLPKDTSNVYEMPEE